MATGDERATNTPALPEGTPRTPEGSPRSPKAGSYIQSEHSYQVGSALLWKRRAEAALDALDKAQRRLQAGKRREQRLKLRLAELQRERRGGAEGRRRRYRGAARSSAEAPMLLEVEIVEED